VVRELAKRNAPLQAASYRGYEAGPQRPGPEVLQALSAVFGSPAPEPDIEDEATEPLQLSGLIAALAEQTQAITRLAAALEGPQEPMVPVSAVREVVRQIVASAPDLAALAKDPNEPPAQVGTVDSAGGQ